MCEYTNFLKRMKGKRVAVLGIGVSNTPLIHILLAAGVHVIACDRQTADRIPVAGELRAAGAELRLGPGYLDHLSCDILYRTPGMRPDLPELVTAQENGAAITSEMESFFEVCPCPILGITGSSGKTTTATLLSEILTAGGKTVHLGGNIGRPLLPSVPAMKPGDLVVAELSSFQLMTMRRSPQAAIVTNMVPNHLDVHTSMDEYITAKANIWKHQSPGDLAVFNADNAITRAMADQAPSRVVLFSVNGELPEGIFLKGDQIIQRHGGEDTLLLSRGDIRLPGLHNVENVMAAAAIAADVGCAASIPEAARVFAGVEHRCQLIRELGGVRYYNDSKATGPDQTIAALRGFPSDPSVILIAGGSDKHVPFDGLGGEIARAVKLLILTGPTGPKIEATVRRESGERRPDVVYAEDLPEAVRTAANAAVPGDAVLLSPASASFNAYRNFVARGDHFKELVQAIPYSDH
jgi:UDP-N-acetylmuramoylalanine--D-glutamate ligase